MRISRNTRKSRVKRYVRKLEVSLVVLLERVYVVFFYFLFLEKSQITSIFFSYINLKYAFCNFFFFTKFYVLLCIFFASDNVSTCSRYIPLNIFVAFSLDTFIECSTMTFFPYFSFFIKKRSFVQKRSKA